MFFFELQKLSPMDTQEVIKDIFVIRDTYANMFLIKTGDNYIAIDAGKSIKNVKKEMQKLNIPPEKVIAVFITHSDYDHIAAVGLFKNAQVYMSKAEIQMINGTTRRLSVHKNKFKHDFEPINDKQTIEIADTTVKGILVPGHTLGLMCWLVNGKYLFTGDALRLDNGKVKHTSSFLNKDTKMLKNSLKQLAQHKEIEYMFTAHFKYSDNFESAFKEWKN